MIWSSPELETLRFDAIQVMPLRFEMERQRLDTLGMTPERAQHLVDLFWNGWIEDAAPMPPSEDPGEARRPLRIVASFTDRVSVPELKLDGSAIAIANERLTRVCLKFELSDWATRELVGAILTQHDAHLFEMMLKGELSDAKTQSILAPHLRSLQNAILPPEPPAEPRR